MTGSQPAGVVVGGGALDPVGLGLAAVPAGGDPGGALGDAVGDAVGSTVAGGLGFVDDETVEAVVGDGACPEVADGLTLGSGDGLVGGLGGGWLGGGGLVVGVGEAEATGGRQLPLPLSVKVPPASGTNCQS